jgi:hypothetical protein
MDQVICVINGLEAGGFIGCNDNLSELLVGMRI